MAIAIPVQAVLRRGMMEGRVHFSHSLTHNESRESRPLTQPPNVCSVDPVPLLDKPPSTQYPKYPISKRTQIETPNVSRNVPCGIDLEATHGSQRSHRTQIESQRTQSQRNYFFLCAKQPSLKIVSVLQVGAVLWWCVWVCVCVCVFCVFPFRNCYELGIACVVATHFCELAGPPVQNRRIFSLVQSTNRVVPKPAKDIVKE
jgi:hypothetical protein